MNEDGTVRYFHFIDMFSCLAYTTQKIGTVEEQRTNNNVGFQLICELLHEPTNMTDICGR